MSDQIAVMAEGRVEQVGTPSEIYAAPATTYVADFLGNATLFRAEVVSVSADAVRCRVEDLELAVSPAPVSAGQTVTVMVRPERVELRLPGAAGDPSGPEEGNVLSGRVRRLTFQGAHTLVSVQHDGLSVEAQVANVHGEPPHWLAEGETVSVRISPSALRLLS